MPNIRACLSVEMGWLCELLLIYERNDCGELSASMIVIKTSPLITTPIPRYCHTLYYLRSTVTDRSTTKIIQSMRMM